MSLGLLVLSSESNACSPLLNLGITKRLVVTKLLIIFEWDPHFYFVVLFAVLFAVISSTFVHSRNFHVNLVSHFLY